MIVAKTPLRISFVGGGSDHLISENSFGSVISIGINKFIYLSMVKREENTIYHQAPTTGWHVRVLAVV